MLEFFEDVNEDSGASVERRFEDGQPAKIRLRYQRSKLMKQLSTSSSSPTSRRRPQAPTHRRSTASSEGARSPVHRMAMSGASVERKWGDPPSSAQTAPSTSLRLPRTASRSPPDADIYFPAQNSVGERLSPPSDADHSSHPPPAPVGQSAGFKVFLPEKHSENPLFADSEEEGKKSDPSSLPLDEYLPSENLKPVPSSTSPPLPPSTSSPQFSVPQPPPPPPPFSISPTPPPSLPPSKGPPSSDRPSPTPPSLPPPPPSLPPSQTSSMASPPNPPSPLPFSPSPPAAELFPGRRRLSSSPTIHRRRPTTKNLPSEESTADGPTDGSTTRRSLNPRDHARRDEQSYHRRSPPLQHKGDDRREGGGGVGVVGGVGSKTVRGRGRSPSSSPQPPPPHRRVRHQYRRNQYDDHLDGDDVRRGRYDDDDRHEDDGDGDHQPRRKTDFEALYPVTARFDAARLFLDYGAPGEVSHPAPDAAPAYQHRVIDTAPAYQHPGYDAAPLPHPQHPYHSTTGDSYHPRYFPQPVVQPGHPPLPPQSFPVPQPPRQESVGVAAAGNAHVPWPVAGPSMSAALVPLDAASTLQSLIAENEELKGKMEKLKKELKEKDLEMQSLKLDAAMREAESDSRMASRVAEVVDELCAAQKERDAALARRLGGVGGSTGRHRRHEPRGRLDDAEDVEDESNASEDDLLETERRLLPYSRAIRDDDDDFDVATKRLEIEFRRRVEEMEEEKRRAEKIVAEEIGAAVEERDRVLAKCRIMREEMDKMKKRAEGQAELERRYSATTQERDAALAKLRVLESKIQDVNIDKGLFQSLSREKLLAGDLRRVESAAADREAEIQALKEDKGILAAELARALEDKETAVREVRRAKKESEARRDDGVQLERLVRLLREKLDEKKRLDEDGGGGSGGRRGGYGRGRGSVGSDGSGRSGSGRSGSFDSDSFGGGSESGVGSPRGSIMTSNARVAPATHL